MSKGNDNSVELSRTHVKLAIGVLLVLLATIAVWGYNFGQKVQSLDNADQNLRDRISTCESAHAALQDQINNADAERNAIDKRVAVIENKLDNIADDIGEIKDILKGR